MIVIELTENEKRDLLVFLNRTNLTGAEVPALINILKKITTAENKE